jgi:hypothetical protein
VSDLDQSSDCGMTGNITACSPKRLNNDQELFVQPLVINCAG